MAPMEFFFSVVPPGGELDLRLDGEVPTECQKMAPKFRKELGENGTQNSVAAWNLVPKIPWDLNHYTIYLEFHKNNKKIIEIINLTCMMFWDLTAKR